jgi:ubiquinone/menaquinone biosynthesis C-methylase UbiE
MDEFDNDILKQEAEFADGQYQRHADDLDISETMFRKYSHPFDMWDWRQKAASLMGNLEGKSFLDYGCGMGEESVYVAKLGAKVTAIDISPVGIEITQKRAAHNNVSDRITTHVMKGNPTEFPPNTFDIVHGLGILHHVGLDEALPEIKRILKPGGVGIFLEPMGSSAAVEKMKDWMRVKIAQIKKTTEVTEDEENLRLKDLKKYANEFSTFEVYHYHLVARVKLFFPRRLQPFIRKSDYYTLKTLPFLKHYAGAAVIYFAK